MKKSDFIKARERKWRECPNPQTASQWMVLVARDVNAAEVAGVTWDSEEPDLPEQVSISDAAIRGGRVVVDSADGLGWHILICNNAKHGDYRLRVAEEMVRRYNAWPGHVKAEWYTSLEQILEYAQREEGKSQQGYFSRNGGGGRPLHELLRWLKNPV